MMDFEITERRENKLLNREEIDLDITHHGEATPSEHEVRKALAAELDLDPRTVRVDHVYSATGTATSRGTVTVFEEPVVEDLPEEDEEEAEEGAAEGSGDEADEDEASDEGEDEEAEEDVEDTDEADDESEAAESDEDEEKEGDD